MLRGSRIFFYLTTDICHVYPENLVIIVYVGTPDLFHDIGIGKNLTAVHGKESEQLEFNLGQVYHFPVQGDKVLFKVESQVSMMVNRCMDCAVRARLAAVTQGGADPGKELDCAKGLGDIVISTKVKSFGLFLLMASGRDHDDRSGSPVAELFYHIHAVKIREPEI